MNRIGISFVMASMLALGGCKDAPSLHVSEEPAGANCPAGGFRVEADGEVFYSCNGQATTETVAAGAPGNPCFGDALRVTIRVEDGTTRDAYVCQSVPVDPTLVAYVTQPFGSMIAARGVDCLCTVDPLDQADCDAEVALFESISPIMTACVGEAIAAAGPFPEADRPALECLVDAGNARNACLDAIPASACTTDLATAEQECDVLGSTAACPEPSAAFGVWYDRMDLLTDFFDCSRFAT